MRVREYLKLYAQLYGIADPTSLIDEGLERFRITHLADAMGNELSSGQRTLIGIVRATLHRPRLLVLDEPTASLDPDVAQRVRRGLLDLCERDGAAMLMTSHDMSDVQQVCERVVFLSHGRIVADGTPDRGRSGVRSRRPRRGLPAPRRAARVVRLPAERSPMTIDTIRPVPAERARQDVAADARDRAASRVRAVAQPAPPVRRDAVAARRRPAVRLARDVRRHVRRVRLPPGRRRTCSPASCCGTSSTSRRSRSAPGSSRRRGPATC